MRRPGIKRLGFYEWGFTMRPIFDENSGDASLMKDFLKISTKQIGLYK